MNVTPRARRKKTGERSEANFPDDAAMRQGYRQEMAWRVRGGKSQMVK